MTEKKHTKKFEADIECPACAGTGLYVGMAERDGAAVICRKCQGTGKYHYVYEYTPFERRNIRNDVIRVFAKSCGYVHTALDTKLEDGTFIQFSKCGVDYQSWLGGAKPKPIKELYCPLQWTGQKWSSPLYCRGAYIGGCIGSCPKRGEMAKCWEYYDNDNIRAELLAALRILMSIMEVWTPPPKCLDAVKAVMAKAEGKKDG